MPKPPPERLRCPKCQALANVYLDEAHRYRLACVTCGYANYLKLIVLPRQPN